MAIGIIVKPDFPVKSVAELIALAKKAPGAERKLRGPVQFGVAVPALTTADNHAAKMPGSIIVLTGRVRYPVPLPGMGTSMLNRRAFLAGHSEAPR